MSEVYRFGLLGHNIDYSKSPAIFEAIAALNRLEMSFEIYDVATPDLSTFVASLPTKNLSGLAITIPHKEDIVPFVGKFGEVARKLGSVNSIKIAGAEMEGHNTDWHGLTYALAAYREKVEGGHALILGTGGSARATAYAICADLRVKEVTVVGRTSESIQKIQRLCQDLGVTTYGVERSQFEQTNGGYALVVNCTPLGGPNQPNVDPMPDKLDWTKVGMYFDMNYNLGNKSVEKARSHGLVALDGSRMLVGQAVKSFEIWTGKTIDIEQIYHTVFPSD